MLGKDHPDTLNSARNLATGLGESGRLNEAVALAQDTYDPPPAGAGRGPPRHPELGPQPGPQFSNVRGGVPKHCGLEAKCRGKPEKDNSDTALAAACLGHLSWPLCCRIEPYLIKAPPLRGTAGPASAPGSALGGPPGARRATPTGLLRSS